MMIDYEDLVGAPYEFDSDGPDTFNCAGIVREVFRRAGWSTRFLPIKEDEAALYVINVLGDPKMHPWEKVQDCPENRVTKRLKFGDVVLARGSTSSHVSVIVDEEHQLAVSAGTQIGVFVTPTNRMSFVQAVYRLREEAR